MANKITVHEVTYDLLRELGLTTVFGNPGSTEQTFLSEFPDDFTYILGLQEASVVAMADGLEEGLRRIDALGASGKLSDYYLFHAARADILRRLGRRLEAAEAYRSAIPLATNRIEQEFLRRRLVEIEGPA